MSDSRITYIIKRLRERYIDLMVDLKNLRRRKQSISIAHVVNPFLCDEGNPTYLYYAQPVTFEAMKMSREYAEKRGVVVELYAAIFPEDSKVVPLHIKKLPPLTRSTLSEYPHITDKKLPFVRDIFSLLVSNSSAEYFVFSNTDICLNSTFYFACSRYIYAGFDAFVINRRDNIPKFLGGVRLTSEHLETILKQPGERHPGYDCFIFHRKYIHKILVGYLFIGYPPWGTVMMRELRRCAKNFHVFEHLHETFHLGSDRAWADSGRSALWDQNIIEAKAVGYDFSNSFAP
jgi:hypothetical protein